MYTRTTSPSSLQLFQQLWRTIRKSTAPVEMLQAAVDSIGWQFGLDRCVIMLRREEEHDIGVEAEFYLKQFKPVAALRYQLRSNSEWYRLLIEGKPIPLIDMQPETGPVSILPELGHFIQDSNSKSIIAFPLINQGSLLGCLTIHYCTENKPFPEELLELGEALAEELASHLNMAREFQEKLVYGRVFSEANLPLIVLERETCKVRQINEAGADLLDGGKNDMVGLPFLELFGESDGQRLKAAVVRLSSQVPVISVGGLLAPVSDGQTTLLDAVISGVTGGDEVIVALYRQSPDSLPAGGSRDTVRADSSATSRVEELVGSLSKQLSWERLTRQIISKLHANLDRDAVLQWAADSVGRALKASACLIIRTDSPTSSLVTHEYADPNLSPLGLGRTGLLPPRAVSSFRQKTVAVDDLSNPASGASLSKEDRNLLLDSGVGAILGTPITHHGTNYGIIVVQGDEAREWTPHEIEMVETTAGQAALALANAQAYAQVKDQLFNMNLISNLTQQLTTALDQVSRGGRQERAPEGAPAESQSYPLSARELEVLKLIASGLANREIAQKLFLTESTVELHASRIRKKLKLKSRTALVKFACDNKLV